MIIPTEPAALLMLVTAALCPAQAPPVVSLSFSQNTPVIDHSASTAQLSAEKVDFVVAHKPGEVFRTGGITAGNVRAGFKVSYRKLFDPATGAGCVWSDRIDVMVDYSPTIHIARENKAGSCRYNAIMDHEMRHVGTDIVTLNEYNRTLQNAVQQTGNALGAQYAANPAAMQAQQTRFSDMIQKTVNRVMDDFQKTRALRQSQIDTRQEYLRLSSACR